jgi:hypothetical protein
MDQNKLIECVKFFNDLEVREEDVTSPDERENDQIVVVATYSYHGRNFETKKLYYHNVNARDDDVKNAGDLFRIFGKEVYWLDISNHDWPHGKGAEIEVRVIKNIITTDDVEFETFLNTIANN